MEKSNDDKAIYEKYKKSGEYKKYIKLVKFVDSEIREFFKKHGIVYIKSATSEWRYDGYGNKHQCFWKSKETIHNPKCHDVYYSKYRLFCDISPYHFYYSGRTKKLQQEFGHFLRIYVCECLLEKNEFSENKDIEINFTVDNLLKEVDCYTKTCATIKKELNEALMAFKEKYEWYLKNSSDSFWLLRFLRKK